MTDASPILITIARQLGSGGSYLGQQVARALDYAYIDRQILKKAAEELGCAEADVVHRDERIEGFWSRLFGVFSMGPPERAYTPPALHPIIDDRLFQAERRVLIGLCCKRSCVVVGHGGFYFLRGKGRMINVFVHAPREFRIARVMRYYEDVDRQSAIEMIDQTDRDRARYIHERTGLDWHDARNYHLSINSARIGFETAARLIVSLARRLEAGEEAAPDEETTTPPTPGKGSSSGERPAEEPPGEVSSGRKSSGEESPES